MSSHKNFLTIEGNLVRDPVLKYTNSGKPVCNFSIANNRYYKQGDGFEKETSFFDVTCWGDLAQDVNNKCRKGSLVEIVGGIKQDRRIGADGKNINRVFINARTVNVQQWQPRQEATPYDNEFHHEDYGDRAESNGGKCPF